MKCKLKSLTDRCKKNKDSALVVGEIYECEFHPLVENGIIIHANGDKYLVLRERVEVV